MLYIIQNTYWRIFAFLQSLRFIGRNYSSSSHSASSKISFLEARVLFETLPSRYSAHLNAMRDPEVWNCVLIFELKFGQVLNVPYHPGSLGNFRFNSFIQPVYLAFVCRVVFTGIFESLWRRWKNERPVESKRFQASIWLEFDLNLTWIWWTWASGTLFFIRTIKQWTMKLRTN